ncbi:hypothetical protein [Nocardia sp. NPDC057227]|uniref:hypothetical protein n=1 Tax=Nocardia sp. NPDC057227 TaxID=3346056 RepID=UPI0036289CE1
MIWRLIARCVVPLLCTALALAGCSGPPEVSGTAVAPDTDNVIRAENGVVVEIPGAALSGAGRVRVTSARTPDGADGWSIELDGATLTGSATLRFPIGELAPGEPAPLVTFAESPDGPRTIAANARVENGEVVVDTTHFSFWLAERWNEFAGAATSWLHDRIHDLGVGSPPNCPGEQAVRDDGYTVTSDSGDRVFWCLGTDAGSPLLRTVNARGYGAAFEYTPGLRVARTDRKQLLSHVAELLSPAPTLPGNRVELVPPGNSVDFVASPHVRGTSGVMVTPHPGAYLLTALDVAFGLYEMLLKRAGAGGAVGALDQTLQGAACLDGFTALAVAELPADPTGYFVRALDMALDCAATALSGAELGPINAFVVAPILWVVGAIRAALDGAIGALDSLDPSGYRIIVTAPRRPTEVVEVVAVDESGNPLSDWSVRTGARGPLDCSYPYPAKSSRGRDIVQCGGTADGAHTCWIEPDRQGLTCAFDVWAKEFLAYRARAPIPAVPGADGPSPEWLELDDGTRCSQRHGGAWGGRADDLRGAYGCDGVPYVVLTEYDVPAVDTSAPEWTVRVGELGDPREKFPPPTVRAVTRAYFTASP